jgi:hypothetical protein
MKYITINDTEYSCNLDTRAVVKAEERLKCNLIDILVKVQNETYPKVGDLLIIFQEALSRMNHGLTYEKVQDLYDSWRREGHTYPEFVNFMISLFEDGGLIPSADEEEEDSKN